MKRDIDKNQNLDLCRPLTKEACQKLPVMVLFNEGSSAKGDVGNVIALSKFGNVPAVQWEDPSADLAVYRYIGKSVVLAPVFWLKGKPVYAGDKLLYSCCCEPTLVTVTGPHRQGADGCDFSADFDKNSYGTPTYFSWPKKIIKVRKEGFLNIYPTKTPAFHLTQELANKMADRDRIDCVPVEWEQDEEVEA